MLKAFMRSIKKEVVHFDPNSSAELELSDGDRAALYGWPDKAIEDVMRHE